MAERRLDAEERDLWARVAATVRPLWPGQAPALPSPTPNPPLAQAPVAALPPLLAERPPAARVSAPPVNTLDGGWDRRLRQGAVSPDRSIDLHGHTLTSAHAALDHALDRAIADGARLLLVVTGRPPREDRDGRRRGLIRAAIGDWLAVSRHAGQIAAVRNAHPRHGGAGALYLILRRKRGE